MELITGGCFCLRSCRTNRYLVRWCVVTGSWNVQKNLTLPFGVQLFGAVIYYLKKQLYLWSFSLRFMRQIYSIPIKLTWSLYISDAFFLLRFKKKCVGVSKNTACLRNLPDKRLQKQIAFEGHRTNSPLLVHTLFPFCASFIIAAS